MTQISLKNNFSKSARDLLLKFNIEKASRASAYIAENKLLKLDLSV